MERGFIKAEVYKYEDIVEHKSEAAVKAAGESLSLECSSSGSMKLRFKRNIIILYITRHTWYFCFQIQTYVKSELELFLGRYRMEGKNYEVQDGDILMIKFNVTDAKKK